MGLHIEGEIGRLHPPQTPDPEIMLHSIEREVNPVGGLRLSESGDRLIILPPAERITQLGSTPTEAPGEMLLAEQRLAPPGTETRIDVNELLTSLPLRGQVDSLGKVAAGPDTEIFPLPPPGTI